MSFLHQEYLKLIAELDKVLSLTREMKLAARDGTEERKATKRLDQLLDERLRLMKLRDAESP